MRSWQAICDCQKRNASESGGETLGIQRLLDIKLGFGCSASGSGKAHTACIGEGDNKHCGKDAQSGTDGPSMAGAAATETADHAAVCCSQVETIPGLCTAGVCAFAILAGPCAFLSGARSMLIATDMA